MVAFADEPDDPVEQLLRLGERQGYLTYEMLNDRLPDEVVSPDKLDALLAAIEGRGIRLVDAADAL
ncbi:MAG TPA: RNA polymerase sigma factor region1.1 domain-containing protein [Tepidisphaeraceae bacterium]|nr:RNA polymerase sigma factor region1.1 domain-containing protein [Tepidisphaeraceae bacterium]